MAANIEVRTLGGVEVASFVENGKQEVAWHGLGKVFDGPLTVTEALTESHADFEVTKQPLVALTPELVTLMENGGFINASMLHDMIIQDKVATMRTDYNEALGVVGSNYGVVQNTDAFKFIDDFCTGGEGTPCIECAGLLGKGERIFITAKFPEPIRLNHKDNDLVDMYIVFTTSHDGKGAVTAMVTPIRVVCNNTLNAAFNHNSGRWNIRHTSGVQTRMQNIAEATRAMGLYDVYKAEFEAHMTQLANIHLTDKDVERISARALMTDDVWKVYVNSNYNIQSEDLSTRTKNQVENLKNTIYGGIGQDLVETNTGLHIYNGVTCFLQNVDFSKNNEQKFVNLMDKSAYVKQQRAFDAIMATKVA